MVRHRAFPITIAYATLAVIVTAFAMVAVPGSLRAEETMRQLANVDDWSTAATAVRDEELASERGGQSLSNGSDGAQGSERLAIILWDEEPPRVPAPQQPSYGGGQGASQGAVTVGR